MRISDWSSDVCSSDLLESHRQQSCCANRIGLHRLPCGPVAYFRDLVGNVVGKQHVNFDVGQPATFAFVDQPDDANGPVAERILIGVRDAAQWEGRSVGAECVSKWGARGGRAN